MRDPDTGLIYMRGRWYDPQIGRFISPDPLDGLPKVPISQNKYAYADDNPVNNSDPLGTMTLGDLAEALDIQGVLNNLAKDAVTGYVKNRVFGCSDADNGPPCLFDTLMGQVIQAAAGSLDDGASTVAVSAAVLLAGRSGKTERHHTIPKYMCGHDSQEMVRLSVAQHRKLHDKLYDFKRAVNLAGRIYDVVFQKKVRGHSVVAEMATRTTGRAAIASGLSLFYFLEGYEGNEWAAMGSGVKSGLPLGYVFPIEATRYELGHYDKGKCPEDDTD